MEKPLTPSQTAEMAVIGAAAMDAPACAEVFETLRPEMFEFAILREIFAAMRDMRAAGRPIDLVTIAAMNPENDSVLRACADTTPSITHAASYAGIVLDAWRRRTMRTQVADVLQELGSPVGSADAAALHLAGIAQQQEQILRSQRDASSRRMAQAVEDYIRGFGRRAPCLATGWSDFDRCMYLVPGHVVVLAARPGGGKTDFALSLAVKAALHAPVLYLSLEMTRDELMLRVAANGARIEKSALQSGKVGGTELTSMQNLLRAVAKQAQLVLDDEAAVDAQYMAGIVAREKPKLLVLDHLGLTRADDPRQTDYQRISGMTHFLKRLAKEQDLCVLELVQLKREVDRKKGGQRGAVLADLKGSGSIEEDSDAVLFVAPENHPEEMSGNMFCETALVCAKNRHGPARVLYYDWMPQFSRYIPQAAEKETFEEVPEKECPFEQEKMA